MMTLARRVATALSMAGFLAAVFRLRGQGGVPPRSGGWIEIDDSEYSPGN
jgi:alpha-beta hydrolase superfamily lysophospholipase